MGGATAPSTGALYLALQRMEAAGLIAESMERPVGVDDARRRYWALSQRGRDVARSESQRLSAVLDAARAKDLLAGDPA
jgi:DNA-binding PadR family transcriptional regulator